MNRSFKKMTSLSLTITFFLALIGVTGVSMAAEHPNFAGVWLMDLDYPGSTDMGPLLQTQGASWLERKAADSMAVTQTLTLTEKELTINVSGGPIDKLEVLKLDGTKDERDTDRIGKVVTTSGWDKDGQIIVTQSKYTTSDGHQADWTQKRYLKDDGKTLVVEHEVKIDDGRQVSAKRFLRRQ